MRDSAQTARPRITNLVPLLWVVLAVIVQLIVVMAMVPALPSAVSFNVVGAVSSGEGAYGFAVSDLVITSWIVIAVFAVAAIVIALLPSRMSGAFAAAALVTVLLSAGLGLILGNLLPQLGAQGAPEPSIPGAGLAFAAAGLIVGLALGLVSILVLPRRLGTRARP